MGLGKGGGAVGAFGKQDQPVAESARKRVLGLDQAAREFAQPTRYEREAGNLLLGQDPLSMLSQGLLGRTLGGEFLDVSGGPYAARNNAISSAAQRFLNQNLDQLGASAQRASGGVGSGSAEVESRRRATTETASQLGETLGRLSAEDLARERGIQSQALELGFGVPLQRAGALGEFGSALAGRQLAGSTIPIDFILKYLTAARQQPGSPGEGLGSILGGLGGAASGAAALFSDERVKKNIRSADNEIDELLDSLKPYTFDYLWEDGSTSHTGVMAQDLEKTPIGTEAVFNGSGDVKMINTDRVIPIMLASIARLAKRVKELEGNNGT